MMVNTKHDVTSYENCDSKREIYDSNLLFDEFLKQRKNSGWKPQTQKFEMNFLSELSKMQKSLQDRTLKTLPTTEFILNERGKARLIKGEQIQDRIIKGTLCKQELIPTIRRYLIYDNGASLSGKGVSFTRKRLKVHLQKFYKDNQGNDGYILLMDYTKYFDNIRHSEFLNIFKRHEISDTSLWLLEKVVEQSRVDVSYMDDDDYESCLTQIFNSLKYQEVDKTLLKGEKLMDKHFNIGCPVAQVAGISYPYTVDNYIKIVMGLKFYGRYQDDSYIIHKSKEYLKDTLLKITKSANDIGITIHPNKTKICKLSDMWRFLQIQYSLTKSGRIIEKINPERLTNMRKKLKKLCKILPEKEFDDLYKSWFKSHYKIMSSQQRENLDTLFLDLKGANYV